MQEIQHKDSDYALSSDFFERILQQEQEYRKKKAEEPVTSEPLVCTMDEGCISCGS